MEQKKTIIIPSWIYVWKDPARFLWKWGSGQIGSICNMWLLLWCWSKVSIGTSSEKLNFSGYRALNCLKHDIFLYSSTIFKMFPKHYKLFNNFLVFRRSKSTNTNLKTLFLLFISLGAKIGHFLTSYCSWAKMR